MAARFVCEINKDKQADKGDRQHMAVEIISRRHNHDPHKHQQRELPEKVFPSFEDEFCTHEEKAYDHVEIAVDKPSQYRL